MNFDFNSFIEHFYQDDLKYIQVNRWKRELKEYISKICDCNDFDPNHIIDYKLTGIFNPKEIEICQVKTNFPD